MMKKLIFIGFLITLSKFTLADFTADPDNKHSLDFIVKIAEENKNSLKIAYVFRYNVARFKVETAATELSNDYEVKMLKENKPCNYNIITGSREGIAALKSDTVNKEHTTKIAEYLEELNDKGQLVAIISALWDGHSGTSDLCSYYEFNAYTVDGYKLVLEFN